MASHQPPTHHPPAPDTLLILQDCHCPSSLPSCPLPASTLSPHLVRLRGPVLSLNVTANATVTLSCNLGFSLSLTASPPSPQCLLRPALLLMLQQVGDLLWAYIPLTFLQSSYTRASAIFLALSLYVYERGLCSLQCLAAILQFCSPLKPLSKGHTLAVD